jgi:hypothetical protein
MKHGIIFWDNSHKSRKIFTLQKKIIRIMASVTPEDSLEILPLPYEYIFSLMDFTVNNQEHFQTNSALHNVNTTNSHALHRPAANPSRFQKSTDYSGIKIFNNLPCSLKSSINKKVQFKAALRRYLNTHSFSCVD